AGLALQVSPAGRVWDGIERVIAARGKRRGRLAAGAGHAYRAVPPPSRATHDAWRPGDVPAADEGIMADLWPGQRIAESAWLCRTHQRPWLVGRGDVVAIGIPALDVRRSIVSQSRGAGT